MAEIVHGVIDRTVLISTEEVPQGPSELSMKFTKTGDFVGEDIGSPIIEDVHAVPFRFEHLEKLTAASDRTRRT